jgi:hypothetical protein
MRVSMRMGMRGRCVMMLRGGVGGVMLRVCLRLVRPRLVVMLGLVSLGPAVSRSFSFVFDSVVLSAEIARERCVDWREMSDATFATIGRWLLTALIACIALARYTTVEAFDETGRRTDAPGVSRGTTSAADGVSDANALYKRSVNGSSNMHHCGLAHRTVAEKSCVCQSH